MFAQILQNLMAERGYSNYKLSKLIGCSQTSVAYWLEGRTMPQNRTMDSIAKVFGVTTAFLRGEEDKYGLSPTDWSSLGFAYKGYRLSMSRSIQYVSQSTGISEDAILNFEENGTPIDPKDLTAMCGVLGGATLKDVFYDYSDAFDKPAPGQKSETPFDSFTMAAHDYSGKLSDKDKEIILRLMETLARDVKESEKGGNPE